MRKSNNRKPMNENSRVEQVSQDKFDFKIGSEKNI